MPFTEDDSILATAADSHDYLRRKYGSVAPEMDDDAVLGAISLSPTKVSQPATPVISRAAIDLIKREEGIDQPHAWPGLGSGISLGRGYDLGTVTEDQFRRDWEGKLHPDHINRLAGAIGVSGDAARQMASQFRDINVGKDVSDQVFEQSTLPDFTKQAQEAFPGMEKLSPDVQGAIVSNGYNRGFGMKGARRLEMRQIRDAVARGDVPAIAEALRSSERLWEGKAQGLVNRREHEAALVESALQGGATVAAQPDSGVPPAAVPWWKQKPGEPPLKSSAKAVETPSGDMDDDAVLGAIGLGAPKTPALQKAGERPPPGVEQITIDRNTDPSDLTPGATGFNAPPGPLRLRKGMTDDDLIRGLGYSVKAIRSAPGYEPGMLAKSLTDPDSPSPTGGFLTGIGVGNKDSAVNPAMQMVQRIGLASGATDPNSVALRELQEKLHELDYQQNVRHNQFVDPETGESKIGLDPRTWDYGRAIGEIGGGMIYPALAGASVPAAALTGAILAPMMSSVKTSPNVGGPQDRFGRDKIVESAGGATGSAVLSGLGSAFGKVRSAYRGQMSQGAEQLVSDAAPDVATGRPGVRLFYPDFGESPTASKMATNMESHPMPSMSMSAERAAQQGDVQARADWTASHFKKAMDREAYQALPEIEAAASNPQSIRNGEAGEVLRAIAEAGDDPNRVVPASARANLLEKKLESDRMYARATHLANPLGGVPVPMTRHLVAVALEEAEAAHAPNEKLIAKLRTWNQTLNDAPSSTDYRVTPNAAGNVADRMRNLQAWVGAAEHDPQSSSPEVVSQMRSRLNRLRADVLEAGDPEGLLGAVTTPGRPADNRFGRLMDLRGALGDEQRLYKAGKNALIGEKGIGVITSIKQQLQSELDGFARTSGVPELESAWKTAQANYKANVVPYVDRALVAAINNSTPDQAFATNLMAGQGDKQQRIYGALDRKGKAAVRYGMIRRILDAATAEHAGAPDETLVSPQKIVTALSKKHAAGLSVAFAGQDKHELDGFLNVMRHVTRAGQYLENPPTGFRLVGEGAIDSMVNVAKLPWTISKSGFQALAKAAFTTPQGINFLLAASDRKPSSPSMARLVAAFTQQVPKLAGNATDRAVSPSPRPQPPFQPTRNLPPKN